MAQTTNIEWADATLNFWIGCTKVGPACDHCYAETWGARFGVKWGSKEARRQTVKNLSKARKLEKLALAKAARGEGAFFCFSNSLSDIFDKEVPIEWLAEAFAVMRAAPHVTFLLLTKRPQNIVKRSEAAGGLPRNAALGCTVVNQKEADRDIPHLLIAAAATLAIFTFVSMEPLLEIVDIRWAISLNILEVAAGILERGHFVPGLERLMRLSWVIAGGESGSHARPTPPIAFQVLRDQCGPVGVPFLFKQWGEWTTSWQMMLALGPHASGPDHSVAFPEHPNIMFERWGKKEAGRRLDGMEHLDRPEVTYDV